MSDIRVVEVEPVADGVIAALQKVLKLARAGELSSVAIVTIYRDGSTGHSWSEVHNKSLMLGGMTRTLADMMRKFDE